MKINDKSEGFSLITASSEIRDIESHCRKVHSDAVVEFVRTTFSLPMEVADKLFFEKKDPPDGGYTLAP